MKQFKIIRYKDKRGYLNEVVGTSTAINNNIIIATAGGDVINVPESKFDCERDIRYIQPALTDDAYCNLLKNQANEYEIKANTYWEKLLKKEQDYIVFNAVLSGDLKRMMAQVTNVEKVGNKFVVKFDELTKLEL